MPHIAPLSREQIPADILQQLDAVEDLMGFIPNDALTMARIPSLFHSLLAMTQAIYAPSLIDPAMKRLVGLAASAEAGCSYCQAHTLYSAQKFGVAQDVLNAVVYDNVDPHSPKLGLAVRFARKAATVPAQVDDGFMRELKQAYSEQEISELLAVISLFGFLNRWNAGNQTEIEAAPATCAI